MRSVMSASDANIADGIRAAALFTGNKAGKTMNCIQMEIDPQKSTPAEKHHAPTAIVFIIQCEKDLASLVLNGAKMELRPGDHLTIPTGSVFQFINSSLNTNLKIRFVQKQAGRIHSFAHESDVEHSLPADN